MTTSTKQVAAPGRTRPEGFESVEKRILGVREAATYLGRTEKSVRHLVERRKLRCVRADGRVMFDRHDLDLWIEMNRV